MRYILGISALYHDSAAALLADGEIIAAAQEERFTRKRHDAAFPVQAIGYCLREAGIGIADVDYVCFYDKPLKKFDRLIETYLGYAPAGFRSFHQAMQVWLKEKIFIRRDITKGLKTHGDFRGKLLFTDHHESHAASAFYPSPFERAAIITCDGVGEWATTTWGVGDGRDLSLRQSISFPHSLGLLYSAFTYFTGFKVNSGEYKLMGLAPYGDPIYTDLIKEHLIDIKPDGSYRLNMDYFTYPSGLRMTGRKFAKLFGGPERKAETDITKREMDLAASIQKVTEEVMLKMVHHVHKETGLPDLCLAGGVALNCVANGRLLREGPFQRIWIQPAAGDAGGALGTALFAWHKLIGEKRQISGHDKQRGSLLGPKYSTDEVSSYLDGSGAIYHRFDDEAALLDRVSALLSEGKVVGWLHGRMEFGPRALGARSILGDPRSPRMQSVMNVKIKFRESFRPFAPCVLSEHAHELFDIKPGQESPYMLMCAPVLPQHRHSLSAQQLQEMRDPDLCKRVNVPRSEFPAITHVDYSARIQTVDEARHGRFYRLIKAFAERTGCPALVNTSFNIRGEPIVNTPAEAHRCFQHTDMDVLVLEDCVLLKEEQPNLAAAPESRQHYLGQFQLD